MTEFIETDDFIYLRGKGHMEKSIKIKKLSLNEKKNGFQIRLIVIDW